jgi:hypothetical protein
MTSDFLRKSENQEAEELREFKEFKNGKRRRAPQERYLAWKLGPASLPFAGFSLLVLVDAVSRESRQK